MKIGIFGGTFNPPHLGHHTAMMEAITQLGLDRLFLVPTATPPHKSLPQHTPSPELRLEMVDYFAQLYQFHHKENPEQFPCKVEVSPIEIQRGGVSYTAHTLDWFHQEFPQAELWLIMGADVLTTFDQWHDPQKVTKLAKICGFCRSDAPPSPELLQAKAQVEAQYQATVQLITLPRGVEISSTQIRQDLAETGSAGHLFPSTLGTILRNHLYGTSQDLANLPLNLLRICALSMIPKPKRVRHVIGVEDMCAQLAKRWDEDEDLARRAGILHDCTKYWSHQQHLDYCQAHNFPLDALEQENEKLLHAKSGGCLARDLFRQDPRVCQAILCHTTGQGGMSTLDKILYLADYVEINRDFPELEKLRALCFQDLDKAMAYGLEITLEEMRTRGKVTHQNTLDIATELGLVP